MLRFFKYYISYLFIHYVLCFLLCHKLNQRAKKAVSDSPRLVDFDIGLVNSVLNLPDEEVKFLRNSNFRTTVKSICLLKRFGAS